MGGVTVKIADPPNPADAAVTVVVPCSNGVAKPIELLNFAIFVEDDVQVTDRVMSWIAPLLNVPSATNCSAKPSGSEALDGLTEIDVRPTSEPLPERLIICGLFIASSRTANTPPRNPLARGVKVTLMVQLPPGIKLAPHVLL